MSGFQNNHKNKIFATKIFYDENFILKYNYGHLSYTFELLT